MEKFTLLMIAVVFALPLITHTAAAVPDSCLKMICPNDRHKEWNEEWHKWEWVGSINPDSVRVDSCQNSPTYLQEYAKMYFSIQFEPYTYPFDTILDTNEIRYVQDISNTKPILKQQLLELQNKFGTILFKGLKTKYTDSSLIQNPLLNIYFLEYQNIDTAINVITNFENVKSIKYTYRNVLLTEVTKDILELKIIPHPIKNTITILGSNLLNKEEIIVYNIVGNIVGKYQNTDKIDVSTYPKGLYIVQIGKFSGKFIKE